MIDTIIDIYHNTVIDLAAAKAGGIVAVIHKATEGAGVQDAEYADRREQARELGLLWGAYHYASGASVSDQVANFLQQALPEDGDLVALDWESSTSGPDMTLEQAQRFAQMIFAELGRWPAIYGGRLLRETIGSSHDEVLSNCPLWYSRYASAPIGVPTHTWPQLTLWQYTDGNAGPPPHKSPGTGRCDRNIFMGTEDELRTQWPFARRDESVPAAPGTQLIFDRAVAAARSMPAPAPKARARSRSRPRART